MAGLDFHILRCSNFSLIDRKDTLFQDKVANVFPSQWIYWKEDFIQKWWITHSLFYITYTHTPQDNTSTFYIILLWHNYLYCIPLDNAVLFLAHNVFSSYQTLLWDIFIGTSRLEDNGMLKKQLMFVAAWPMLHNSFPRVVSEDYVSSLLLSMEVCWCDIYLRTITGIVKSSTNRTRESANSQWSAVH